MSTAPSLDLHEGIGHARRPQRGSAGNRARAEGGCERWPPALRLASTGGDLVKGRCRSTRQCDYCARLGAVEWAELLALDALHGVAPSVYVVTTTRETKPDLERVKQAKELLLRAVRRRWPGAEYVCIVEFTTGRSTHSRGRRFPHWNWLLKGVPVADLAELHAIVAATWTAHLDAEPQAQFVGDVYSAGGLMRYLALHFMKEDQRPPRWWHGHRVTRSRGYLWLPTWKARAAMRESLTFKRELHRAIAAGHDVDEAGAVAELAVQRALSKRWECVELTVDQATGELVRARPISGEDTVLVPLRPLMRPGHGTIEEWALVDGRPMVGRGPGRREIVVTEDEWPAIAAALESGGEHALAVDDVPLRVEVPKAALTAPQAPERQRRIEDDGAPWPDPRRPVERRTALRRASARSREAAESRA